MTARYAHRGARAIAPENTLPAFQAALDLGVDGIELDVQRSSDDVLVVMHDFTVDRTTNGCGRVAELTLAEIKELDAGESFDKRFSGTRVPTLDEVLNLIGDRCAVNVEIKSVDYRGGEEVDAAAALIKARNLYDQILISSFNPISLIKMRHVDARIRLGRLYAQELPGYLMEAWLGELMGPEALHPHHRLVGEAYMERMRAIGKTVNVWTVNEVAEASRLHHLGVDAIISDVPDVILPGLSTPAAEAG
jgi:glycerophosphoryl diester phosphodiesterase